MKLFTAPPTTRADLVVQGGLGRALPVKHELLIVGARNKMTPSQVVQAAEAPAADDGHDVPSQDLGLHVHVL